MALALALLGGPAWAACVEDAESGPGGLTMEGLWHVADGAANTRVGARSGTHSFYFGRDAFSDYADFTVKDASLTTPPLSITSLSDAVLSFWTKWQVESVNPSCYDQLWLEREDGGAWVRMADIGPVSDPSGGTPSLGMASGTGLGGEPQWQLHVVDLSAYAGGTHRFRFRFKSGAYGLEGSCFNPPDYSYDNYLGWVIDDIALGCPPAPLTLQKSASPGFAVPGSTVTFTLQAKNWDTAARNLEVWDTLPPYAQLVSASHGGSLSGGLVTWNLPAVAPFATQAFTLVARIDPSAPLPQDWANTASGLSSAGGSGFTSAEARVRVRAAGLSLRKSASQPTITSGDRVTFTIELSNFNPAPIAEINLREAYPSGFVELGQVPAFSGFRNWKASNLQPGETRWFTVWGVQHGLNMQTVTNRVEAWNGAVPAAEAEAQVLIKRPEAPQMSVRSVFPNPAPSGKAGLPQSAFVYFETNQALAAQLTVLSVAGDVVRRIPFRAERGKNQVEWDLRNDYGQEAASGIYVLRLSGTSDTGGVEAFVHLAVSR